MKIFSFLSAIDTDDLLKSLEIFWKGMLAIGIVLGAVFLATKIMTWISNSREDGKARHANGADNAGKGKNKRKDNGDDTPQ